MPEKNYADFWALRSPWSFRIQEPPFVPSAPWAIRFMRVCGGMKGSVVKSVGRAVPDDG